MQTRSAFHAAWSRLVRAFEQAGDPPGLLAAEPDGENARLRARVRALESQAAARTRFLAALAHEIRTPLNGVLGIGEALLREERSGSRRDLIAAMVRSGDVLRRLAEDALDIARIEEGRLGLEPKPFRLGAAIRAASELYAATAGEKGLWLEVAIAPEAEGLVLGDEVRVRQIVQNLLSNAVKFTARGGVAVRASHGTSARIEVFDTGPGLPADPERLFERFARSDTMLVQPGRGAGLGLSICRDLALMMGGRIIAYNRLGGGAAFRVDLPLAAASEEASAPTPRLSAPTLDGARILAADDHKMSRLVLEMALAPARPRLTFVTDGLAAVEAASAAPFDLILLDLHMPEMDGLTCARTLRAMAGPNRGTPILALTADARIEHVKACLDAGMNGHLAKPIEIDALFAALAEALQDRPKAVA